jgi:uncharacterized protein (DUF1501 family)
MSFTRRDFFKFVTLPAAATLMARPMLRAMFGPADGGVRNIVFIDLKGGCDGLNMVVPYGLDGGTYYSEFRGSLAIPQGQLLQLGSGLGLNPTLTALKSHFDAGRLAIVQGVSYPDPSFSHEVAEIIWQTGELSGFGAQGWLGKHLQAAGGAGPVGVSVEDSLTLLLDGSGAFVPAFTNLDQFNFPTDPWHNEDANNRRAAYEAIAAGLAGHPQPKVSAMSATTAGLLDLIDDFAAMPGFEHVGVYPDNYLADLLKLVAKLLHGNLGLRYFHLPYGGWDTHADQEQDTYHSDRMGGVSDSMHAFWQDLGAMGLQDDTLVVVFSEFGRTVHQNGSKGTDHGTVNPVLVLGNGVTGGLITPHPSMDPDNLTEDNELPMQADFRDVFGTLVVDWLGGSAATAFPGHSFTNLGFVA